MRRPTKRTVLGCLAGLGALLLALGAVGGALFADWLNPVPEGEPFYIRFESRVGLGTALTQLEQKGVVRRPAGIELYVRLRGLPRQVGEGTYELRAGMSPDQILGALRSPVQRMVRFPEGWWIRRVAARMEDRGILSADSYIALAEEPERFAGVVSFPLPEGSLEGYLYPDTYDLPPLTDAEFAIRRQLEAFEEKVWNRLPPGADLERALIIASMVELEVARDEERAVVAGVIENRLRLGMPLQIDATLNYAIQEWRPLTFRDYREIDSPYSTYRNRGLPPGPIGSPTWASIEAALNPAEHDYLYYVAMPEGYHLFSRDYETHRANIARRRAAIAALE